MKLVLGQMWSFPTQVVYEISALWPPVLKG